MQNPRLIANTQVIANTHAQMCPLMERERIYILTGVIESVELATKMLRELLSTKLLSLEAETFSTTAGY